MQNLIFLSGVIIGLFYRFVVLFIDKTIYFITFFRFQLFGEVSISTKSTATGIESLIENTYKIIII